MSTLVLKQIPMDPRNESKPMITCKMKADCIGEFTFEIEEPCPKCMLELEDKFDDVECLCEGSDEQAYYKSVTVPWDTCKEIYQAMAKSAIKKS